MMRNEILDQITATLGGVPGWLERLTDEQLSSVWGHMTWFLKDTHLTAKDKALVAFGAAAAVRCPY